jgi:hypothetical protein
MQRLQLRGMSSHGHQCRKLWQCSRLAQMLLVHQVGVLQGKFELIHYFPTSIALQYCGVHKNRIRPLVWVLLLYPIICSARAQIIIRNHCNFDVNDLP